MKIGIVVGTRPEIIKMAPVVRACLARDVPFLLLHTGQHYSFEMDGVFFQELDLPAPHVNLEVGSGGQAYQVAAVMSGITCVSIVLRPDIQSIVPSATAPARCSIFGASAARSSCGGCVPGTARFAAVR